MGKKINKKKLVRLDRNESYFFLNQKILNDIKNFDGSIISTYPSYEELKQILAIRYKSKPENILLTNGADQAVHLVIQTLFKKEDEVLLPAPTFVVFTSALKSINVKPKVILYKEKENNFIFSTSEVLSSIDRKIKGILLCNPNNPLGSSITKKEILSILNKTKKFDIPVVIDEVYAEFYGYSSINLTKKYKNLIIIKSFSKEFAMSGLRFGFIMANKELVKKFYAKRGLPWTVNHFALYTAKIFLKHKNFFNSRIKEVLKRKKEIVYFLRQKGIRCYDTDTNFVVIKVKNHRKLIQHLKKNNILVSDISKYTYGQKLLKGAIRMSIPSETDMTKVRQVFN